MDEVLRVLISGLGFGGIVFIFLLFVPDQVEKWSGLLWKGLRFLGAYADKRYIKHDLQGRVGEFVTALSKEAPHLEAKKLHIEWVDDNADLDSFLKDGDAIIRLRRNDPQDQNFARAAYMFVSTSMLYRVKRYLSPTQKQTLDLFVTTRFIEKQKPGVIGYYLDEYLHPKTSDPGSKVAHLYEKFAKIDRRALFFTVLLEELAFLGNKVFGQLKKDTIMSEVSGFVDFLEKVSLRNAGEQSVDLNFEREYCRSAVMLVGKSAKLTFTIDPYVDYIRKVLMVKKMDTIYLLARLENKQRVDEICKVVSDVFETVAAKRVKGVLRYSDGEIVRDQYIVVLRLREAKVYQLSQQSA